MGGVSIRTADTEGGVACRPALKKESESRSPIATFSHTRISHKVEGIMIEKEAGGKR